MTPDKIDAQLTPLGKDPDTKIECFQTTIERKMAERIHRARSDGTPY